MEMVGNRGSHQKYGRKSLDTTHLFLGLLSMTLRIPLFSSTIVSFAGCSVLDDKYRRPTLLEPYQTGKENVVFTTKPIESINTVPGVLFSVTFLLCQLFLLTDLVFFFFVWLIMFWC